MTKFYGILFFTLVSCIMVNAQIKKILIYLEDNFLILMKITVMTIQLIKKKRGT